MDEETDITRLDRQGEVIISGWVREDIACEFFALLGKHRMTRKAGIHEMLGLLFDRYNHPQPPGLADDLAELKKRQRRRRPRSG
jgi:hypothetical protein